MESKGQKIEPDNERKGCIEASVKHASRKIRKDATYQRFEYLSQSCDISEAN